MLIDLFSWWQFLQPFEMILWSIALFFSLLFILQTILSLLGGALDAFDIGDDIGDGDGYQFFTIKNMIAFFTMFGWAGLAAYNTGSGKIASIFIALVSATLIVCVMYFLMRNAYKLKHSGTLELKNAVHQVGETYLRIPGNRQGVGKIHVQVQGKLIELDAMTDDPEDIATGKPIQVVDMLNNQILLVTSNVIAKPTLNFKYQN